MARKLTGLQDAITATAETGTRQLWRAICIALSANPERDTNAPLEVRAI